MSQNESTLNAGDTFMKILLFQAYCKDNVRLKLGEP